MASETEICNLAISHLGIGKEIQNLTTEKTEEARACRTFYSLIRDTALRSAPWNFAKRTAALALVETNPTTDWQYSYRYPSDCVLARRLLNGLGFSPVYPSSFYSADEQLYSTYQVPFMMGADDSGSLLYTSQASAVLEYTKRVEDTNLYTPDFTMALSYLLASAIAPRITAGDDFKIGTALEAKAQIYFDKAFTIAANEMKSTPSLESEFIRVRN